MIPTHVHFASALTVLLLSAPLAAQVAESRATTRPAADNITFALVLPPPDSRPAASRPKPPVAIIRITNKNTVPVTLWPFVSLEIRDAKGAEPKPSTRRGRWGRRREPCFLEAVNFTTLAAGASVDWPVTLDTYTHDPDMILGWRLAPGEYTLTARTTYARADFIARCKLACATHADPLRPWNTALELTRDATLKFTVK